MITVRLRSADPATHKFVVAPVGSERLSARGGTLTAWETRSARTRPSTTTSAPARSSGRAQSKAKDLLGPFPTAEEAANALEIIREREERKNAEDREWRDR